MRFIGNKKRAPNKSMMAKIGERANVEILDVHAKPTKATKKRGKKAYHVPR